MCSILIYAGPDGVTVIFVKLLIIKFLSIVDGDKHGCRYYGCATRRDKLIRKCSFRITLSLPVFNP